MTAKSTAPAFLEAAAKHMCDRAATYDKPEGERSMAKTVKAFNAITGRDLSTAEGWLLLQVLKQVRVFTNPAIPHQDSLEDNIAYGALLAEEMLGGTAPVPLFGADLAAGLDKTSVDALDAMRYFIHAKKEPPGHHDLLERVMQKAEEAVQSACKAPETEAKSCETCRHYDAPRCLKYNVHACVDGIHCWNNGCKGWEPQP